MCNRAWRFRNDLDRLGKIGGVNHREAGDRQGGRHKGGVLRLDSGRQRIAHLHRRARGADQGSACFQFRVVGVSCVADVFGCAFISCAVAISNRHEFRHLEFSSIDTAFLRFTTNDVRARGLGGANPLMLCRRSLRYDRDVALA
jgi:hypothetical protein